MVARSRTNKKKTKKDHESASVAKADLKNPEEEESADDDVEGLDGEEDSQVSDAEYEEQDEENEDEDEAEDEDETEGEDEAEDKESDDETQDEDNAKSDEDSEPDVDEGIKHKQALSKLKQTDPEFYQFLQENDRKLLKFNESDDSDNESEAGSDQDTVHKPPRNLEVDSDESDFEDSKRTKSGSVVTLAMVQSWRQDLIDNGSKESIEKAVDAFRAALDRVSGEENSTYKVESSAVFNAVIEMCVMHLAPAVTKFLRLTPGNLRNADKSKKWSKIKFLLQTYFTDLLKLLSGVASEHIISVLLKHLHALCYLVALYSKLGKTALKHLTKLWSTGEETVRVLAFLCILRLATSQKSNLLNSALKLLYISYIRGSKFVSVNTLAQINFMRRSLSSLFLVDQALSYQHAFLYIRQLAIHLRNAVTVHKKENFQSVYNWQYMASMRLWVDLLCSAEESSELHQLIYPLIQIIIGVIKLLPTAQYIPLRFHCIKLLIQLGRETDTYIPTLPFIIEGLTCVDLNKQHKKASMKPFDFTCILRMSKSAMTESAFTDGIVENVYNLLVEATMVNAHRISFPDIVVPAIFQLRTFVKESKVVKYSTKLKQILSKIEETAKFVNSERSKLTVNLAEIDKIKAFEKDLLVRGTPFSKFHQNWRKVNEIQIMKRASEKAKAETEVTLPTIKRKAAKKSEEVTSSGPVVLFPSDDESDIDLPVDKDDDGATDKKSNVEKIPKKKKREAEIATDVDNDITNELDDEDIVEDLKLSNF